MSAGTIKGTAISTVALGNTSNPTTVARGTPSISAVSPSTHKSRVSEGHLRVPALRRRQALTIRDEGATILSVPYV